jgi:SAM-dependent methyltransferase
MNILNRINRKVRRELRSRLGPRRECNACHTTFRGGFLPLSPMYLDNLKKAGNKYTIEDAETLNYKEYMCPHCQSSDRDRLYALYLDAKMAKDKVYHILDFAPAPALGKYLKQQKNVRYRSADLFMEGVDDKVDLMDMNIYADNTFDIFVCSHVLEHVDDDKKAMKELFRVLKPGGFGIAMVPIVLPLEKIDEDPTVVDPTERWRRFGQEDHVRAYSKQGFIDRLAEARFAVEQITVADFSKSQFLLHGISLNSVLYIVRK